MTRTHLLLAALAGLALATISACAESDSSLPDCADGLERDENGRCVPAGGGEACSPSDAVILINEVLYVLEGSDGDREFIELSAPTGTSLDGYRLVHIRGSNGTEAFSQALTGEVGRSGLFVIGGSEVENVDQVLRCTSSSGCLLNTGETLQLRDCNGDVVDAIAYGKCEDRDCQGLGDPAPASGSGNSLARCPAARNSGDNSSDFHPASPTPGTPNSGFLDANACTDDGGGGDDGGDDETCNAELTSQIRINEVLYVLDGPDGGNEFIELVGPPGTALDGLNLSVFRGSGDGTSTAFPPQALSGKIGDNGLFVIGGENVQNVDLYFECTTGSGCLPNSGETITITGCDGETIDSLGYGDCENRACSGLGDPAPASGQGNSLARCPTADITDDNATDFAPARPSPGEPNSEFLDPSFCGDDGGSDDTCSPADTEAVRINEVLYVLNGPDGGNEFIELIGPPGTSLNGMTLKVLRGSGDGTTTAFPPQRIRGEIGANGLFVIGGDNVDNVDLPFECTTGSGCLPNAGETIQILACDDSLVDALAYGDCESRTCSGLGYPAPASGNGRSLARCPSADITDDNGTDFAPATPSPGQTNSGFIDAEFCPEDDNGGSDECDPDTEDCDDECDPDTDDCEDIIDGCGLGERDDIVINELRYVMSTPDGGHEFIELYGPPGAILDGLYLVAIGGAASAPVTVEMELEGTINQNGYFVIGGEEVPNVDQLLDCDKAAGCLQNSGETVQLRDCDGTTVIDALAYGTCPPNGSRNCFGEGDSAPASGNNNSLARCPGAPDTDDNATDFGVSTTPTPGEENAGFRDGDFCDLGNGSSGNQNTGCDAETGEDCDDECDPDTGEFCECDPDTGEFCECNPDTGEFCECDPDTGEFCECNPDTWEYCECDPDTGEFCECDPDTWEYCECDPDTGEFCECNPDTWEYCECDDLTLELRINEILYDPEGADAENEFIEIIGPPGTILNGARLAVLTGGPGAPATDAFEPLMLEGELGESGLFLVGGAYVEDIDMQMPCASCLHNTAATIKIFACDGALADAVSYGDCSDRDCTGFGDPAPLVAAGVSISRCPGAEITDDNATDFGRSTPSPGEHNSEFLDSEFCSSSNECNPDTGEFCECDPDTGEFCECDPDTGEFCECDPDTGEFCECDPDTGEFCECDPDTGEFCECDPDTGEFCECDPDSEDCDDDGFQCILGERDGIVINELLYELSGSDGGREFIELYGPPGMVLDGLTLVAIAGASTNRHTVDMLLEGVINENGYFVIGGDQVANVDQLLECTNASGCIQNSGETVQLRDCDGMRVIDALGYGECAPNGSRSCYGEGTPAPKSGAGNSLARCPGAADTDDNAADFGVSTTPTPGEENAGFRDAEFCPTEP